MSFRISYFVTAGLPRDIVQPLGFRLGVETDALPYDEWWVGSLQSNGKTVFWAEAEDFVSDIAAELATLSHAGDVVACRIDEDAETAQVVCYHNGRKSWEIVTEATAESLQATGDLPPEFANAVVAHAENPIEVALEMAKVAGGFRHDLDLMNRKFARFFRITADTETQTPTAKRGFLAKLLGR